jgi:prolyl 4-hydroxylase
VLSDSDFEVLSSDPLVVLIHNFVTSLEADALISAAETKFKRSTVVCDEPGGCLDSRRTSESAHLGYDARFEPIRQRARELSGLDTCETIQVVRYYEGQEFRPHLDAFDPKTAEGAREIRTGGQRGATFLVYLQDPEAGGATVFPEIGLSVAPERLAAVFWRHQRKGSQALDKRTLHGGAPVLKGRKIAANIWLRQPRVRYATQINEQLAPMPRLIF